MSDNSGSKYAKYGTAEYVLSQFLPDHSGANVAVLNLDSEARKYAEKVPSKKEKGRFSEADFCQDFVDKVHTEHNVSASFGGYLEDRSFLWHGTYLDQTGKYIHLGVDFNVPAGSPVIVPFDCEVVRIDDDFPENWGWGPRVFLRPLGAEGRLEGPKFLYIFAHLSNLQVSVGDRLVRGAKVATIGSPPRNGNWFPHLHVQTIREDVFQSVLKSGVENLDGYGFERDTAMILEIYPDPIELLFSKFQPASKSVVGG